MSRFHTFIILGVLLLFAAPAYGQDEPPGEKAPPDSTAMAGLPESLRSVLDSLGASSGVADGTGFNWTPRVPVRGQTAQMALTSYQFGLTAPISSGDKDLLFANGSFRSLDIRTPASHTQGFGTPAPQIQALLPTDNVRFPRSLWDIQAGGGYISQFGDGWNWGVTLNVGTASDKPFHSLNEATLSTLAFVRMPTTDRNGWLFYVVSTSNGQLGRNIPVPGVAYEYHSDRLNAVVGFPFVTVDYRPIPSVQLELNYAAITDVLVRASYYFTDRTRVFTGFEWTNQAWFRAARPDHRDQLFLYEKRFEGGIGCRLDQRLDFRLAGGYAFDRFFVENRGLSFRGRNRVDLGPGPFAAAQLEFKF